MSKFYLSLWLHWLFRLTLTSLFLAAMIAGVITVFIYINQGMQTLSLEIYHALFLIFKFWFVLSWSVTLLISLFLSLKYIFNRCLFNYQLKLLSCPQEGVETSVLEDIGYGDLVKVWRKWLMLLIWIVGGEMILLLTLTTLFASYDSIFEWFNIYILYILIGIAGYFSFMVLSVRCKKVKVTKC
ncbi:hypothetical protein [Sulfurimonas sp.]|uniref:hypothetical protein n=1 Tax=Sulfurimonas sp. TaxID=2022749 RepID=UPI0026054567|nr:hypothetical protein [Sulfurimonas sp.]